MSQKNFFIETNCNSHKKLSLCNVNSQQKNCSHIVTFSTAPKPLKIYILSCFCKCRYDWQYDSFYYFHLILHLKQFDIIHKRHKRHKSILQHPTVLLNSFDSFRKKTQSICFNKTRNRLKSKKDLAQVNYATVKRNSNLCSG